jgi:hypothetical protein
MSKRKGIRGVILLVPCLLLLGTSAGMQETGLPSSGVGLLIEVHGREIAYVPTTAKYSELASTGQNTTSYVVEDVGWGTYYFYVRAYNADGVSIKSNHSSVKTW